MTQISEWPAPSAARDDLVRCWRNAELVERRALDLLRLEPEQLVAGVEGPVERGERGERQASHAGGRVRGDRVARRPARVLHQKIFMVRAPQLPLEDPGRGRRRGGRRRGVPLLSRQLGSNGRGPLLRRPGVLLLGNELVVRFRGFDRPHATEVARLRYPPSLGGPAVSVSSDGRWMLSTQSQGESDLMLVESFR